MNINYHKKTNIYFSYLYVFLILFFSTKASALSSSILLTRSVAFTLLIFFLFNKINIEKKFFKFVIFFFLFALIICYKYDSIQPFIDFLFFFVDVILLAYFSLKFVGSNFFIIFEKIVYKWALFSAPLFLLQLIIPDTIFKLNATVGSILSMSKLELNRENYSNSILFTMNNAEHIERNCGFMWEPGAFGAMLIIAFVIYLNSINFKFSKKSIVYLLLILSTFSTTAYLNLLLIPFFYLFNSKQNKNYVLIGSIMIIGVVLFLNFSSTVFLDKIFFQLNTIDTNLNLLDYKEETVALDRFASLIYLLPEIQKNFWLGTGWSYVNDIATSKTVNLSNGLAFYFVIFGFVGFMYLIFNLFKTALKLFDKNKKQAGLFVILILNIGFSNPTFLLPFFISLQLFYLLKFDNKFYFNNKKIQFHGN
ncbi:O-antigen ligase family protein [Flavobacterium psychrotolerans]|uniref:O-antigen ligase-related domain-containing protein n=1 Tax=Flavobacterium psychrotolerans TaxID=2169410 RepID=A0A2U1JI82_9FLAO|nr:O-antigen ligase family protein [Flavobacterium psychrotolerans]PWA04890.1 hypothetical protein DB895_08980 [Flavobacterium psychrotolerans]